jgi:CRISPR system Cascade subunit CasB
MVPGESPPGVFYRFAFRHLPEGWEQAQREWMTILAGMAIMVPAANSRGNPAGKMLGESGYSESRLERLLSAEGDVLETLVLRVARFAAAKAQPIDWTQLAQLLLAKNPERADAIRMRIAKDYYRAIR